MNDLRPTSVAEDRQRTAVSAAMDHTEKKIVSCPCGGKYWIPTAWGDEWHGHMMRCPHCSAPFKGSTQTVLPGETFP